jgi:hypothetical protein
LGRPHVEVKEWTVKCLGYCLGSKSLATSSGSNHQHVLSIKNGSNEILPLDVRNDNIIRLLRKSGIEDLID